MPPFYVNKISEGRKKTSIGLISLYTANWFLFVGNCPSSFIRLTLYLYTYLLTVPTSVPKFCAYACAYNWSNGILYTCTFDDWKTEIFPYKSSGIYFTRFHTTNNLYTKKILNKPLHPWMWKLSFLLKANDWYVINISCAYFNCVHSKWIV